MKKCKKNFYILIYAFLLLIGVSNINANYLLKNDTIYDISVTTKDNKTTDIKAGHTNKLETRPSVIYLECNNPDFDLALDITNKLIKQIIQTTHLVLEIDQNSKPSSFFLNDNELSWRKIPKSLSKFAFPYLDTEAI